ncbi:hypothetical protein CANMA_003910 [Candida margitis]|uniref:uncharacterized protein n=1 Tax=Candida margitis TaxID=1775924 RepID=UPI002225F07E|nr:uncharacterized protein CANMA_003910 [Candida margitis]KAI5961136.1 hypothetical protein CANMA_003910 [Candida margitis]
MADYASQTVAQLKEILKERGLSTEGKKADLVARLTESDSGNTGEGTTTTATVEAAAPVTQATVATETGQSGGANETTENNDQADTTRATTTDTTDTTDTTTATEAKEEKEAPKVLTPEERKTLAVELLNKKIARAEKFGDEAAAEQARKDLNRVSKFGVELGTSLAREIGLVDNKLGEKKNHGRFRGKKFGGKHHHRGFKKNNRRN